MSDPWADAPSPCVDVCKYKRQGRCVACTMTKAEKDSFPQSGNGAMKKAFIMALIERVSTERNPAFWAIAYRRKCERAGVPFPLDGADDGEQPG